MWRSHLSRNPSTFGVPVVPYSIRPREPDTRCPDGFACYGWRRISKAGYVLWYGRRYYAEELKQLAGLFVWIEISDWLAIELDIFSAQGDRQVIAVGTMESDAAYCARKGIVNSDTLVSSVLNQNDSRRFNNH
jgi:23S rRNA A2030 N6-methylase RlmJ